VQQFPPFWPLRTLNDWLQRVCNVLVSFNREGQQDVSCGNDCQKSYVEARVLQVWWKSRSRQRIEADLIRAAMDFAGY
jgi:hypothetical protein